MAAVPKGFRLSRNGEKEKRSCQLRRFGPTASSHARLRYAYDGMGGTWVTWQHLRSIIDPDRI